MHQLRAPVSGHRYNPSLAHAINFLFHVGVIPDMTCISDAVHPVLCGSSSWSHLRRRPAFRAFDRICVEQLGLHEAGKAWKQMGKDGFLFSVDSLDVCACPCYFLRDLPSVGTVLAVSASITFQHKIASWHANGCEAFSACMVYIRSTTP